MSAVSDKGRQFYLDIDGAMAYATVWLNGKFVGGWPYGYASFELDLTPYVEFGADNVIWRFVWTIRPILRAGIRAAASIATSGW